MDFTIEPYAHQWTSKLTPLNTTTVTLDPDRTVIDALQVIFRGTPQEGPEAHYFVVVVPSNPVGKRLLEHQRTLKSLKLTSTSFSFLFFL